MNSNASQDGGPSKPAGIGYVKTGDWTSEPTTHPPLPPSLLSLGIPITVLGDIILSRLPNLVTARASDGIGEMDVSMDASDSRGHAAAESHDDHDESGGRPRKRPRDDSARARVTRACDRCKT